MKIKRIIAFSLILTIMLGLAVVTSAQTTINQDIPTDYITGEITAETVAEETADDSAIIQLSSNPSAFMYGDLNSDNVADILDTVILEQYLADWPLDLTETQLLAADVYKDDIIDINDAIHFKQYLAKVDGIELGDGLDTANVNFNYGYIKAIGVETFDLTTVAKMKIMDKTGKTKTYTLADKVALAVNTYNAGEIVEDGFITPDVVSTLVGSGFAATLAPELCNICVGDIIDYKLNADGKICSIEVSSGWYFTQCNDKFFKHSTGSAVYNERNNKLGGLFVTEDTVIFCVGQSNAAGYVDENEFFVTDWSVLEDTRNYAYTAYCVNEDNEIGCLAITSNITFDSSKDAAAVFVNASRVKNEDGITVQQITYYQDGELKTMNTTAANTLPPHLSPGLALRFTSTAQKDEILYSDGIWYYDFAAGRLGADGVYSEDDLLPYQAPQYDQNQVTYYAYGQVIDRSGNKIKLGGFTQNNLAYIALDQFDIYTIPETANVYVVTSGRLGNIVEVGAITDISKNRFFYAENGMTYLASTDEADNYSVLIKFDKDMNITDVIAYKNFCTKHDKDSDGTVDCAELIEIY